MHAPPSVYIKKILSLTTTPDTKWSASRRASVSVALFLLLPVMNDLADSIHLSNGRPGAGGGLGDGGGRGAGR